MIKKKVDGTQQVHQIKFTNTLLWIHLHDLLLMARNKYMGRLIGDKIGRVVEVDIEEDEMAWGEFL